MSAISVGAVISTVGVGMMAAGRAMIRSNPYHLKLQATGVVVAWVGAGCVVAGVVYEVWR